MLNVYSLLLNLDAPEVRRLKFDLIMCYKVIFGIVCVNRDECFEFTLSQTRGHPFIKISPVAQLGRHFLAKESLLKSSSG